MGFDTIGMVPTLHGLMDTIHHCHLRCSGNFVDVGDERRRSKVTTSTVIQPAILSLMAHEDEAIMMSMDVGQFCFAIANTNALCICVGTWLAGNTSWHHGNAESHT